MQRNALKPTPLFFLLLFWAFAVAPAARAEDAPNEAAKIRHALHALFDRADAPLAIDPVVVSGDHAVAGWTQGDMGGRALLHRHAGAWTLQFCSGDALKSAQTLAKLGVPLSRAAILAKDLATAEAKLAPERLAMLSRFEGLMKMDDHGQHPPHRQENPPKTPAPAR
jgi:hypothetical protein